MFKFKVSVNFSTKQEVMHFQDEFFKFYHHHFFDGIDGEIEGFRIFEISKDMEDKK